MWLTSKLTILVLVKYSMCSKIMNVPKLIAWVSWSVNETSHTYELDQREVQGSNPSSERLVWPERSFANGLFQCKMLHKNQMFFQLAKYFALTMRFLFHPWPVKPSRGVCVPKKIPFHYTNVQEVGMGSPHPLGVSTGPGWKLSRFVLKIFPP